MQADPPLGKGYSPALRGAGSGTPFVSPALALPAGGERGWRHQNPAQQPGEGGTTCKNRAGVAVTGGCGGVGSVRGLGPGPGSLWGAPGTPQVPPLHPMLRGWRIPEPCTTPPPVPPRSPRPPKFPRSLKPPRPHHRPRGLPGDGVAPRSPSAAPVLAAAAPSAPPSASPPPPGPPGPFVFHGTDPLQLSPSRGSQGKKKNRKKPQPAGPSSPPQPGPVSVPPCPMPGGLSRSPRPQRAEGAEHPPHGVKN